jgi:hypothetical protein
VVLLSVADLGDAACIDTGDAGERYRVVSAAPCRVDTEVRAGECIEVGSGESIGLRSFLCDNIGTIVGRAVSIKVFRRCRDGSGNPAGIKIEEASENNIIVDIGIASQKSLRHITIVCCAYVSGCGVTGVRPA